MRNMVMLVTLCSVFPWFGCPPQAKNQREEDRITYKFVEVTGKKLEIYFSDVFLGQTDERIPSTRFGAQEFMGLGRQNNEDGTNDYFPDLNSQARLIFKHNGKEVKISEEEWISSSESPHVVVKIQVVEE